MKRILAVTLTLVMVLAALTGCNASKKPSGKEGEQPKQAQCLSEENGVYKLTLPKSKEVIELYEEQVRFVPYITDELVETAENKINEAVSAYSNSSDFYLQINDGYLCLVAEVIKQLNPPSSQETEGEIIDGGCGIDHEHLFFSERISTQALEIGISENPQKFKLTFQCGDILAQIVLDDAQKETVQELLADRHDWIDEMPESVVNCYFTGFFVKAGYCSNSGTLIDYISDRSRKLTAEEKAFVESLISMVEEPTDSGYEVEVELFQYTWDGWGISTKTMWIESGNKIYRLTPDFSQICLVETHFGAGKVLEITDAFKTNVNNAWHHAPYDYYKGTYNKGDYTVDLESVFKSGSTVQLSIKKIQIESGYDPNNTITVELISSVDQEVNIKLHCQQSDDNLAAGDYRTVQLKKGEPTTVDLTFGGWPNFTYWVYIEADYTKAEITINP